MLPVRPNEVLPIVRAIDNPYDTNTYYVQAVIKNARTLAVLDTVQLTDQGSNLFSYNWRTPADPTAQGIYIIIVTTIYTDSGYTTKSDIYAEQTETYKIESKDVHFGGGGADVDYQRVRKIVQEELGKVPKVEIPETEQVDLAPMTKTILQAIAKIKFPENKEVDLSGLSAGQQQIVKAIQAVEFPETDLKPVIEAINKKEIIADVSELKVLKQEISDLFDRFKNLFGDDMTMMRKSLEELANKLNKMPYVVMSPQEPAKKRGYR